VAFAGQLARRGLDAALVTDLLNIRYLTGFTGSAAVLLMGSDGSTTIATDGRYREQVAAECPDIDAVITRSGRRELADRALATGAGALGFEDRHMTVAAFRDLPHSASWQPLAATLDDLRMTKDASELDALRRACAATDAAWDAVISQISHTGPGLTERQVARWVDDQLRDRSEGPGFDTIVASGPHGAIPHHQPTDRPIGRGDLVTIDFGARVDGYHADMTRTLLVGVRPEAWQLEVYDVVQRAQEAGVVALHAQASASEVDAAARDVVSEAGFGDYFVHGLGHGVGLQIHEAPYLGSTSTDKLGPSVPITVEPGVYLPGRGGVRIEDTVVVHSGRVESLTTTTRDLLTVS
jgi:Xaa-Pro aminopeptidase